MNANEILNRDYSLASESYRYLNGTVLNDSGIWGGQMLWEFADQSQQTFVGWSPLQPDYVRVNFVGSVRPDTG